MERDSSPTDGVRPLADAAGVSGETAEVAVEMERIAADSPRMAGRLPAAIAAGCLYAAALAVGSGRNGGLRFEQSFRSAGTVPRSRSEKPESDARRNVQIGDRRTDHESTEMTISEMASISPASLRRYSREVAAIYLESDAELSDSRARERLSRLTLR